jgi:hypothetical protein
MRQVAFQMIVVVAQQEQRTLPGLQHFEGEIAKAGCQILMVVLPEFVEVPATGTRTVNQGDQIGRLNSGQHL